MKKKARSKPRRTTASKSAVAKKSARRKSASKTTGAKQTGAKKMSRKTQSRLSPRDNVAESRVLSRAYARPRSTGLSNVPKSEVGATVQDFLDLDDARVLSVTSMDGKFYDVIQLR